VKTPEQEAVLRSIRKLMEFWRITPDELEFDAPIPAPVVEQVPPPPVHRYLHPLTGETWNGQGSQPPWLREALTREGYTVDELRRKPLEDVDPSH
jgi:DNA-binding protein H-NS